MLFEFELRLYQNNHFRAVRKQRRDGRQDHADGDEAHIRDGQADRFRRFAHAQVAGVHAFVADDARVVPQLPIELSDSDVDSVDARSAVLEQAIGEAAGG